jgi:CPA2 family monovalent cation:H+ antiporter-2
VHDLPLITTVAAAFTAAWLLGLLTQRLGLSPIVGYLLGGVLIGPFTPGFVGDVGLAQQLAEVGVILLMFGVGLHFQVGDLLAVKRVAIPGAIVQSLVATIAAVVVFGMLGIPAKSGVVIGMAMAVASTVVLMRVLIDADALASPEGHVAVGWLIVEDVFTVILLVLIPVLGSDPAGAAHSTAGAGSAWASIGIALAKLVALVFVVMVAGARVAPWVLSRVARLRSRELFTLTVLVLSIAVAAGAYYAFGASMALGAFLAGMVVAQSPVAHQAAADALPMRDAFAVLFFVSVGMLFDPAFLVREPLLVLAALGVILIAKPLAALGIVIVLGYSARTALTVALGLAQIGEFSFILAQTAREHGLLEDAGYNMLVASAILSITVNPLLFRSLPAIERWLRGRPRLWALLNRRAERRAAGGFDVTTTAVSTATAQGTGQLAIVVGYGPVGRAVERMLRDARIPTMVVDLNTDVVAEVHAAGGAAIYGDAANPTILEDAGIRRASHLVVTVPRALDRAAVVAAARQLDSPARILVRARYLREREELERSGVAAAVFEEAEGAIALARLVLTDAGVHREAAEERVRDLRLQLIRENLSSIRTQKVRSVMMPWNRVQWLPFTARKETVLRRVAQERFSRWPVVDPETGAAAGYLLAKDLVAEAADGRDWHALVRPLRTVRPESPIETTLARMQEEGATVYLVAGDDGRPVGLITLDDVLEQVVGRIEDEYPHDPGLSLPDTVGAGGILLDLAASSAEAAIRELAAVIPPRRLPRDCEVGDLAVAREAEVATDLGNGVAIPHARCAGLRQPVVVFGRSRDGIAFSADAAEPVRLVFLVVTPLERPDVQLSLVGKIAGTVADVTARERLRTAASPAEVLEVLSKLSPRNPVRRD